MSLFRYTLIISTLFISLSSCDKNVSETVNEPFIIENSRLFLDSNPKNASIFIDGKNTGKYTPDTIKWLAVGDHELLLKTDLFKDYKKTITVQENELTEYYHNYFAFSYNFASLFIKSNPEEADIYFDDSLLGYKTPYKIDGILPGNHKIKLTYPEHRADSISLVLSGGTNRTVNIALTDTSIWVNYDQSNSDFSSNKLNDLIFYDKNVWIATSDQGIVTFNGKTWNSFTSENSDLIHNSINKIKIGPDEKVWVCTHNGLSIFDGANWSSFTSSNSELPDNYISDIAFDNSNKVWITTQGGLCNFDNGVFTTYNSQNSDTPTSFFTAITIDKLDRKWLGTNSFGIIRFDGINWDTFSKEAYSLPGSSVNALSTDKDGNVWAGFRYKELPILELGGIARFSNTTWQVMDFQLSLKNTVEFYNDADGSIWIGTRSGLLHYKSDSDYILYKADNSGLTRNEITSITKDVNSNIWVGATGGGLTKFKTWK